MGSACAPDGKRFLVTGGLQNVAPEGGVVTVTSADGRWQTTAQANRQTGNFFIAEIAAGNYTVEAGGNRAPLTIGNRGEVSLGTFAGRTAAVVDPRSALAAARTIQAALPQQIVHPASGTCLEIPGGAARENLAVGGVACTDGPAQRWALTELGGGGLQIRNASTGLCLSVRGASMREGVAVEQVQCNASVAAQRWRIENLSDSERRIVNLNSAQCVDVAAGRRQSALTVRQMRCRNVVSQAFRTQTAAPTSAPALRLRGATVVE